MVEGWEGTGTPAVVFRLQELAERRPGAVAVVGPGGRLSFGELGDAVRGVAAGLRDEGLRPGDRVAFTFGPDLPLVLGILGAWEAGCVAVPLNHRLSAIERDRALGAFGPGLIVDAPDELPRAVAPAEGAGGQGLGEPGPGGAGSHAAAVLLTSGTSGEPRGVELTHANLEAVNGASVRRLGLGDTDRWLLSLSPGHVGGLAMVHRWILTGSGLEIQPRFDPGEILGLVLEGRVTHLSLVPAMLVGLVEALEAEPAQRVRLEAASHLRCLLIGGAACPPVLVDRALSLGLPLALTYGLTQASSQVATATPPEVRAGGAGCGRPLEGAEVRIVDAVDGEGDGGGAGEILVRGPTVAARYLGTDDPMTDPDGWLHTGDGGWIDQEGRLHVHGRMDGLIISGGSNVQPEEVESFLRSLRGIRDAVVLGLPDERWGQRVCAALTPEHPDSDPDGLRESVLAACRQGLAPAKRPRTILVAKALPLTPNGKIDREAVRVLVSAFSNDAGRSDSDPGPNP